jgi:plasmid maintenance system antidote protein VapI
LQLIWGVTRSFVIALINRLAGISPEIAIRLSRKHLAVFVLGAHAGQLSQAMERENEINVSPLRYANLE